MPDKIEDGVLYISIPYCTAIHKCPCGCGEEVVTPLSPTDWCLSFNGVSISLSPSIGNWGFECKSHYWIVNNQIKYSAAWTQSRIASGRKKDKENKKKYISGKKKVIGKNNKIPPV